MVTDTTAPDRLTARVLAACDAVGAFIEAWGFKSIHGRVWTLLMLRAEPMSQTQVADVLGVSRSLVHLAISELTDYGLVRATAQTRNAPYEACVDVWPTITDVLRNREWMLVERARLAFDALITEAEESQRAGETTVYDPERIRLLLSMTELAQATLRFFISVRVPRSLRDFGQWLGTASSGVKRLSDGFEKLFR